MSSAKMHPKPLRALFLGNVAVIIRVGLCRARHCFLGVIIWALLVWIGFGLGYMILVSEHCLVLRRFVDRPDLEVKSKH